jgi:predicted transcriptional regulator
MVGYRKVTIIRIKKPQRKDINAELQWFGASLGLFNLRDKDRSCYRIFVELIKATKKGDGLSSDEIAYKSGLSRGTVIHHINKLIDSGLVVGERSRYLLKKEALKNLVNEIEHDLNKTLKEIKEIANDLDSKI